MSDDKSGIAKWWDGLSDGQRTAITIVGCGIAAATAGAVVYAIATRGMVIVSGGTTVAVGAPAMSLARGLA